MHFLVKTNLCHISTLSRVIGELHKQQEALIVVGRQLDQGIKLMTFFFVYLFHQTDLELLKFFYRRSISFQWKSESVDEQADGCFCRVVFFLPTQSAGLFEKKCPKDEEGLTWRRSFEQLLHNSQTLKRLYLLLSLKH